MTTFTSERSASPPHPAGPSICRRPPVRRWPAADDCSDDELVERFQDGDTDALATLLRRHRSLVNNRARAYFLAGADADDIEQEGLIGLLKAARSFRPDRRATFVTFAQLCINAQVLTAVKMATRKKHRPLNQYVSISAGVSASGEERPLEQLLHAHHHPDPAEEVVSRAGMISLHRQMARCLSSFEVDVLTMYVEGLTYREIGERLGRPAKAIDNALQRIKRKVDSCFSRQ